MGSRYSVNLWGYQALAKDTMSLLRFKQIQSVFHPEADDLLWHNKCHQLRYFIQISNYMAMDDFYLAPNVSFDEERVGMRSSY